MATRFEDRGPGPILRGIEFLSRRPPGTLRAGAVVAVLLVGVADYLTGPDLSFSVFYLIPASMVAWHTGRGWGALIAFLCAVTGWTADALGPHHEGHAVALWWNAGSRLVILLALVFILSALHRGWEREKLLARTDPLTGAMNRRAFYSAGEREIRRCRRYGHPLSVFYLDLDRFKEINDTLGHRTGDLVLRAMIETLRSTLRGSDLIARIGGDELAVLLPETRAEEARSTIERLLEAIGETVKRNGWQVTVSAGVVTFLEAPAGMDALVQVADETMYRAKRRNEHSYELEVIDA